MAVITLRRNLSRPLTVGEADANIENLNTQLVSVAAAAAALATQVAGKADQSALTTGLAGKSSVGHGHAIADVAGLQTALDAKVGPAQFGQPNGVASLDATGKIPQSQLPALSIADFLGEVASEAVMLTLDGQPGDWCIRLDTGTTWLVRQEPSNVIGNWRELAYPTAPVTSVNGKVGQVALNKGDISLANVDNTSDANKPVSTAQQAALNAKANTSHSHVIGDVTGLATALAGKADTAHTQEIASVNGLQAALDAKAQSSHSHAIGNIAGLQAALDSKQGVLTFQDEGVPLSSLVQAINFIGAGVQVSFNAGVLTVEIGTVVVQAYALTDYFASNYAVNN